MGESPADEEKIEAIASALCELVRIEPRLRDAIFGAGSFERELEVSTFSGPHVLRFAPCVPPPDDDALVSFGRQGAAHREHADRVADPLAANAVRGRHVSSSSQVGSLQSDLPSRRSRRGLANRRWMASRIGEEGLLHQGFAPTAKVSSGPLHVAFGEQRHLERPQHASR